MNWKVASISELVDGTLVRVVNNVSISSFTNLIDTEGIYKIFEGSSVAFIRKGSLGIVFDHKIEIIPSEYLNEDMEKIEASARPFKFDKMHILGLIKYKTHTLRIDHHILKDLEALTVNKLWENQQQG